jgi:hypothetical protein
MMTIAERHYLKGGMDKTREILLNLLQTRFGELPKALESKIHSASTDQLEKCLTDIFNFQSIDDAKKWWN